MAEQGGVGARGARMGLWLLAAVVAVWALAVGWGSRPMAAPSMDAHQRSHRQAVDWLRTHEALVLGEGNAALWWMLDVASQRTQDSYLQGLVQRHRTRIYQGELLRSPWQRMVAPDAEVDLTEPMPPELSDYQRFFYRAVTCAADQPGAQPDPFRDGHVCHPQLTRVWWQDRVCSTHQLMGLMLQARARCQSPEGRPGLSQELLSDIHIQAWLDPMVKDAYIQRVLMLAWGGATDQIRSAWLHRILLAQRADGGWAGAPNVPELPTGFTLDDLRARLLALLGRPVPSERQSDFHATAQGLLLTAMLGWPEPAPAHSLAPRP